MTNKQYLVLVYAVVFLLCMMKSTAALGDEPHVNQMVIMDQLDALSYGNKTYTPPVQNLPTVQEWAKGYGWICGVCNFKTVNNNQAVKCCYYKGE